MIHGFRQSLTGHVLFPFTNSLANRRGILASYASLRSTERLSRDELDHLRTGRLRALISRAVTYVPYYTRLFKSIGMRAEDVREMSDLRKIPSLSREDLQEHAFDLVDFRLRGEARAATRSGRPVGEPLPLALLRTNRLVQNTSSGSTGEPTLFFDDGSRTAANWAQELRLRGWFGIGPGAAEVRFQRVAVGYNPRSLRVMSRALLWNQLMVPGTNMSDREYALCARSVRRFKPEALWGYTSSLVGMATYLEENGADRNGLRPRLVVTWAAPLYPHEEELLSRVYGCPVTNVYGSREVGHVAARCPCGSWHINDESLIVDIDGSDDSPGEILVTTLLPSPMPFIRYRMGDLGRLGTAACPCGRTLTVLSEVLGRTGEVFRTKDGRMISPNFWCRAFMASEITGAVRRFQVVYTAEGSILIRVERGPGWGESSEKFLRRFISEHFSPRVQVALELPKRILPDASGKYRMVVNKTREATAPMDA